MCSGGAGLKSKEGGDDADDADDAFGDFALDDVDNVAASFCFLLFSSAFVGGASGKKSRTCGLNLALVIATKEASMPRGAGGSGPSAAASALSPFSTCTRSKIAAGISPRPRVA
mmetsp:Transcript_89803/g.179340  ORF Transcript_89803/g.179340 Transcript_89803/m.179340 type:complete len:114 (+) Transcript_89803:538-879(+)